MFKIYVHRCKISLLFFLFFCQVFAVSQSSSTVIISEVLYDTPLQEANGTQHPHNGEFISFYNYGNGTVNISGWQIRIDGTTEYTFPTNTYISPYGIIAVAYRSAGSGFNVDSFY
ncbi:MAG: lamin tail domain-containing protein, partial [Bacteroidales bacterium]|nr:lamin tail domain-containing protein [Bacteroidales bacterium]